MKIPNYKYISRIFIPEGVNYTLENIDDTIYLKTDSIRQPEIILFPEVNIGKEPWVVQKGNKLIQIDGKEEVLEESHGDFLGVTYISVEGIIEKVLQIREDEFIFKGNKYNKFLKFFNTYILENNRKMTFIYDNMEIIREKPKNYIVNKNGISLVYDGYTEIISKSGSLTINEEKILLGRYGNRSIFQGIDGKILLDEDVIGFCENKAELLGVINNGIVISCGDKVKYFSDGIWQEIEINANPFLSFVNSNFIILTADSYTLVYDKNLFLIYKFLSSGASATTRYIVLFRNPFVGVVDSLDDEDVIRTEKNVLDTSSPIKILIRKNYDIEYQNVIEVNRRDINSKYYEVEVEPKLLGDYEAKFKLISPFFSLNANIPIISEKPRIYAKGSIIRTNGEVLGTKMNSYINLTINTKIITNIPYVIRIRFRDKLFDFTFNEKEVNKELKIPINIFDKKDSNEIIKIEIIRNNVIQSSMEFLVPIIFVEPPKEWKSKIVDRGDYIEKILYARKGDISWTRIYHYPKHKKAILIKENSKEGIKISGGEVIVNLENPIENLYYTINYPYLVLIPEMKYYYPIEVFYGTHSYRGLPEKITFPLDPAYDEVFIRIYIGDKTVKRTYKIPKEVYFKVAANSKNKLEELLKSFGIV
ncbi:MAG: hypothetical protein RXQ99_06040 [Acidianus sp.]|uniref:protein UpsX n=1 Tax=Acidianus sp. TaxID=1872104 RepID=UPI00397B6B62